MQTKSINHNIAFKDADVKKGIVTGYLSHFGSLDHDGDVIQKGAFSKTLQEKGVNSKKLQIKYLLDHFPTKVVGVFTDLKEDSIGLAYEAQIGRHSLGQDYLLMCEDGIITSHSIGYQTIKEQKQDNYNLMTEINLFEGSGLQFFAANENTPITGIKSQKDIFEMAQKLEKALKHGKYTDESMRDIETKYQELSKCIKDAEMQKQEDDNKEIETKSIRERIELKGMDWRAYELMNDEQKECYEVCQQIEYKIKEVASACGVAQLNALARPHAEKILGHAIDQIAYLESAENAMIMGGEMKSNQTDIETKSITDPLKGSQPNGEETALEAFIKSLKN
jgi:HK97 family phage prohead protease